MDVYIYRAELHCSTCAESIRARATLPSNPDESSYDSDEWPKGPFGNGGGEADYPQHCGSCGRFLKNPLTPDGRAYLDETLAAGGGDAATLALWAAFYGRS